MGSDFRALLTLPGMSGTRGITVNRNHRSSALAATPALLLALLLVPACGGGGSGDDKGEAEKKALEAAAAGLVEPVGLLSAYQPHLAPPDDKQKYFPQRHADLDRAMAAAATEIRHAANAARQNLERAGAAGTKDVEPALKGVTVACTDATELEALAKCATAVTALDAALQKADAARTAAGASAKIPRIAPESVTSAAKKSLDNFLKAKGSSAVDVEYVKKRSDPGVTSADVISACQAAVAEADTTQKQFERTEEHIRLIAVTHKMSLESQCGRLSGADTMQKDVAGCKKKAKTPDCKVVCGKAKAMISDGLPAAAFEPFAKEYAEICEK